LREIIQKNPLANDYSGPVNKAFYELEKQYSGGEMGVNQAYIITV